MDKVLFAFPIITAVAILLMRTYYKKVWDRIRLPLFCVMHVLSVVVILVMLYAAYVMIGRSIFSVGEKILYVLLDGGIIAFFVWMNISIRQKWKNEQGKKH